MRVALLALEELCISQATERRSLVKLRLQARADHQKAQKPSEGRAEALTSGSEVIYELSEGVDLEARAQVQLCSNKMYMSKSVLK